MEGWLVASHSLNVLSLTLDAIINSTVTGFIVELFSHESLAVCKNISVEPVSGRHPPFRFTHDNILHKQNRPERTMIRTYITYFIPR